MAATATLRTEPVIEPVCLAASPLMFTIRPHPRARHRRDVAVGARVRGDADDAPPAGRRERLRRLVQRARAARDERHVDSLGRERPRDG